MVLNAPATLFEKIWRRHVVLERDDGTALLYIDRQLLHEGSFHAFNRLRERGMTVAHPEQTLSTADHYVPTTSRNPAAVANPEIRRMLTLFDGNMAQFGITAFNLADPRQGSCTSSDPSRVSRCPASSAPYAESGKVKLLAVTGESRDPLVPNVPTMKESGLPGATVVIWFGLLGPAGLPANVVDRLRKESVAALNSPEAKKRFKAAGFETDPLAGDAFEKFVGAETKLWKDLAASERIVLDE